MLLVAAGLLLLGLVTTIAVAWGLAAWLPHRHFKVAWSMEPETAMLSGAPYVEIFEVSRRGMVRREWGRSAMFVPSMLIMGIAEPTREMSDEMDLEWGRAPEALRDLPQTPMRLRLEDARGWPRLALWCEFERKPSESLIVLGGIAISNATTHASEFCALPLRPIWRGLVVNTMFYAGFWALVIGVARWRPMRRRYRRRRGLCAGCGYDLRGLAVDAACSECGVTQKGERGNRAGGTRTTGQLIKRMMKTRSVCGSVRTAVA